MNAIEGHTPLPWGIQELGSTLYIGPVDKNGRVPNDVARIENYGLGTKKLPELKANAALIINAVNSHAELVAALENLMADNFGKPKLCGHEFECRCAADRARSALAKAKGEQ